MAALEKWGIQPPWWLYLDLFFLLYMWNKSPAEFFTDTIVCSDNYFVSRLLILNAVRSSYTLGQI